MDLHLSPDESVMLAQAGLTTAPDGSWRTAMGTPVSDGAVATLLAKGISPADFRRGPLTEGHAAQSPGSWIRGVPPHASPVSAEGPAARTGPAGPRGEAGSGTADADMDGGPADGDMDVAKMTPDAFRRHYLAAGHAAESPAVTGYRGTTPVPESHPAEPQDYERGWLHAGHQEPSPGDQPGNSQNAAGTPGPVAYQTATAAYQRNQAQTAAEHLMPSQHITSMPTAVRPVMLPPDMRAASVPQEAQAAATRIAPGETRR